MGKDMPLAGIFDKTHDRYKEAADFRALIEVDAEARTVFDTALASRTSSGSGACTRRA